MGFPCLRIYVPGKSEVLMLKNDDIYERKDICHFVQEQISMREKDFDRTDRIVLENMDKMEGLDNLAVLGIVLRKEESLFSWLYDLQEYVALIAYSVKKFDCSIESIAKSWNNNSCLKYVMLLIKEYGNEIIYKINNKYVEEAFEKLENKKNSYMKMVCGNCKECILQNECAFQDWNEIFCKCEKLKKTYVENYKWILETDFKE